jgi:exopolyphosphatase/guanosine-5'-triphosphate,3'-diphosphate pyrophosphatase
MNKLIGVIDIGTNTSRLAVFEIGGQGARTPVVRHSVITRLGQGVNQNKHLLPEAVERTLAVLDDYVKEARGLGVDVLAGVGTSALRDAANAGEFVDAVRARGVDFKVVAGENEARLVFAGAATAFDSGADNAVLVIDVGGGSTEMIRGRGAAFERVTSLNIGAVRMTEQFLPDSPPRSADAQAMEVFVRQAFESVAAEFSTGQGGAAAAVGGTITTIAALHIQGWDPDRVHGLDLPFDLIESIYKKLIGMSAAQIAELPGMEPKRADIITAGVGVYVCLLRAFGLAGVRVSLHDIRHGVCEAVLSGVWQGL